ncbi:MAG: CPBP family glutamic-type intramembrane protease [Candidatus Zipacnadales bacterium]
MDEPVSHPVQSEFVSSIALLRQSLSRQEGLVGISALLLLLVVRYHWAIAYDFRLVRPEWKQFGWVGINLVCLLGLPLLVIRFGFRERAADYGLGLGEWRTWLRQGACYLIVVLPIIAIASRWAAFREYYPMFSLARQKPLLLLPWELAYGAYFFAWEFFFRGYLLQGLAKHFGPAAIILQNIPFVMMHFGKPEPEVFASVLAGMALGITAYRSRSTIGCWLVHWICAMTMDVLALL